MKYKQVKLKVFDEYFSSDKDDFKEIYLQIVLNGNSEMFFGNYISFKVRVDNFNPIAAYATLPKNYKSKTFNNSNLLYYINEDFMIKHLLTQR